MKQNLYNEIRGLRNGYAHGGSSLNPYKLAKRFSKMGFSVSADDIPQFMTQLLEALENHYVPKSLLSVLEILLEGKTANIVCDPWAGIGTVLSLVCETTRATEALGFTKNNNEAELGRMLLSSVDWHVGDPFQLLSTFPENLDVLASVLPFGERGTKLIKLETANGTSLLLNDDLGHQILAASSLKLSANGIGLFVIPESFFTSRRSVLRQFDILGLGITAAMALPPGSFTPYTKISTYLIVVGKRPSSRMFVAQLSTDSNTNLQIIENFKQGHEGASLELGRFVEALSFNGIGVLRTTENLLQAERRFGYPSVGLQDLATSITLGQSGNNFVFPNKENSFFIPLIGTSDVVSSLDNATIKLQNYAQLAINSARSDARFVARFLNSDLGKEIREFNKSGSIPKLNMQSLKGIRIFIPDIHTQKDILKTEAHIIAEQNTLSGLQNEIEECRRELWVNPGSLAEVSEHIAKLSSRLSGDLTRQSGERLDQWFESLPFPMASILRAWQATPSDDFKTKHEHLLHFFEASAEFMGIILLSAFCSREQVFEEVKKDLTEVLMKQNLSFKRATFGTWKVVIEYLGKQVRRHLSGDEVQRKICADMFADPSAQLPEVLSCSDVAEIVKSTNKMRNDWGGHGGVVGQEEAHLRNEQLLAEVQKLREATGDLWSNIQLVHALHCRPRRGLFENEVAVLMGSNSEFLKETRAMLVWLDIERLYFVRKGGDQALQLLPLIQVGSSPPSTKNACYFFNRIEKDGLRYVSYHFIDQPERMCPIEDAQEILTLLQGNNVLICRVDKRKTVMASGWPPSNRWIRPSRASATSSAAAPVQARSL